MGEIRKKFNGIMHAYGLVKPSLRFEDEKQNDQLKQAKSIFKDKKLQRLWQKAYKAGLQEEELILLKNEFQHHQEKLDEFHQLKQLSAGTIDGNLMSNHLTELDDEESEKFD